jgi:rhodanese-related sulfurtransferase
MLMPSLEEMLSDANDEVPKVTAEEAHELISGRDALLVDVRDAPELMQLGMLKGAVNISRGMLEFRADPYGSYYNPEFRAERPVVLYCASGGRSALAGKTLREMGYAEVYNLGGFKQATDSGFPTESVR